MIIALYMGLLFLNLDTGDFMGSSTQSGIVRTGTGRDAPRSWRPLRPRRTLLTPWSTRSPWPTPPCPTHPQVFFLCTTGAITCFSTILMDGVQKARPVYYREVRVAPLCL